MFSLLEQHKDGSWWYHPGCTFNTPEEVEECFQDEFKMHPEQTISGRFTLAALSIGRKAEKVNY